MTRRVYHYDEKLGRMVEGPAERKTHSGDGWRFSDRLYSAAPFVGKDGKVINSRKKHRDYMKRHSLTTIDDFKGTWADAAKKRERHYTDGSGDRAARREAVERSIHKLEK
jgi:hypothetical protein